MEAPQLPSAQQVLGLIDGQSFVPYRARYPSGPCEGEPLTFFPDTEFEPPGKLTQSRLAPVFFMNAWPGHRLQPIG